LPLAALPTAAPSPQCSLQGPKAPGLARRRENELRARLDESLPTYAEALQRGDRDIVPLLFGQSADFVHAVRPAADVLRELCETAEHHLRTRVDNIVQ
jgi:hypothetical protein